MLWYRSIMKSAALLLPATLAAAALLAAPSAAHAGGYVSLGVGTAPTFHDDLSASFSGEGHASGRAMLGQKLGRFAIEAGLSGYGVDGVSAQTADVVDGRAISATVSGKFHVPLGDRLTGYLRGGLGHTWLRADGTTDLEGRSYHGGLGMEYGFEALLASGSIWVEIRRDVEDLARDGMTVQGTADTVSVGVSIGL